MIGLEQITGIAKPIVETASSLIEKLAGKPCEVAGEMLADRLYLWKWQQRVKILHRAEQVMAKDQIAAKVIPNSFLLPLLDAAGNIEDDELQELWSNLIASGVESDIGCQPSFVETLKGLSYQEARLLREVASKKFHALSVTESTEEIKLSVIRGGTSEKFGFADSDQFWSAAIRLESVGILVLDPSRARRVRKDKEGKHGFDVIGREIGKAVIVRVSFSRYGANFYKHVAREAVCTDSISDPWDSVRKAKEAAIEASKEAGASVSMSEDHVNDILDRRFRSLRFD